jgi:rhodanese-related sulfurtransferase
MHVKLNATSKSYDHYELFLRTENDKARLFNPPDSPGLVPFHELAPRWDGIGLIISAKPMDLRAIMAPAKKRAILHMVIALAAILVVRWVRRSLPKTIQDSRGKLPVLSMIQGIGFVTVALICGIGYHYVNNEGFLAHSGATRSIQQAHAGNFIPKISSNDVRRLLDGNTVFVDARLVRDFEAGHLEGAISLPVDANDIEYKKTTADIAKDARIVLYCQSSACKYAEIVAIKLIENDYSNISILRGGWVEWVARNGKKEEAAV